MLGFGPEAEKLLVLKGFSPFHRILNLTVGAVEGHHLIDGKPALLTRLNDGMDLMPVAGNGDHDSGGHGVPFVVGRPNLTQKMGLVKS